jgi:hypothetical protein
MEKNKDDDDDDDGDGDDYDDDDDSSHSMWGSWFRVVLYPELRFLSWRLITVEFHLKDDDQDISVSSEHWTYDVIQIWQK